MRELLLIALVLACPLLMMFMMRGHSHGGGAGGHAGDCHDGSSGQDGPREASTDDLRRRRAELDRLIEEREKVEPAESERELTHWDADRQ
jgi:hypothetical protein